MKRVAVIIAAACAAIISAVVLVVRSEVEEPGPLNGTFVVVSLDARRALHIVATTDCAPESAPATCSESQVG